MSLHNFESVNSPEQDDDAPLIASTSAIPESGPEQGHPFATAPHGYVVHPTTSPEILPPLEAPPQPLSETAQRRDQIEREKAEQLGLIRPAIASGLASGNGRMGNMRRAPISVRHLVGTVLVIALMLAAFGAYAFNFYQINVLPSLAKRPPLPLGQNPNPYASSASEEGLRIELKQQLDDSAKTLGDVDKKINELQKQIDALRLADSNSESQLNLIDERLTNAITTMANIPANSPATGSSLPQLATASPPTSVVAQELILLKERNRLTDYADQAIAESSAEACAALWRSLRDPELTKLKHAAAAEIIRVQNHFLKFSRVPADYRLPIRSLFTASPITTEADLTNGQLIELMLNASDFAVRTRAAFILSTQKTPEVGDALIRAMKVDPTLDVVREAQMSMEHAFGMTIASYEGKGIPLFDITSAEAWWREKSATMRDSNSSTDKKPQ